MEGLTRLVSESLVRHGLERPLDYRRLRWSRWFRCESHHSLLQVPSKPGVFALAEEITHVGTPAPGCPAEQSSAAKAGCISGERKSATSEAESRKPEAGIQKPEAELRRMLAVTHFFEDDDMAFVLDRMLTLQNSLRDSLNSGRYFVRFVVIEDRFQRRSIHSALTQWLSNSAERASGIGIHFAASLDEASRTLVPESAGTNKINPQGAEPTRLPEVAAAVDSGAAANRHCPPPFPSGF